MPDTWPGILEKARGQTVYFNAWAGDENTNAFIAWAAGRLKELYGINLTHVKITLASEAVARVVAEKAAGRHAGGSIDLIWINGENFLSMKEQGLLFGPFTQRLPNFALWTRPANPPPSSTSPYRWTAWSPPGAWRRSSLPTTPPA